MPNTDATLRVTMAYATAPTWEAARDMLAQDPSHLLLTDRAEQLLQATITATTFANPNEPTHAAVLQDRLAFLRRARVAGVAQAWAERGATAAPVAADPAVLPQRVGEWLDTPTYLDQRAFLSAHRELLDPLVDRIMAALIAQFTGKENEKFLRASWKWLQSARQSGLDAGWQTFCEAMGIMGDPAAAERLLQTLLDWLNTSSFDEQRSFLAMHSELLNPYVDKMLDALAEQYSGQKEEKFLRAAQIWLQRARQSGLEAGWHAFQLALAYDQPQNL